jgi:hypothetical protein
VKLGESLADVTEESIPKKNPKAMDEKLGKKKSKQDINPLSSALNRWTNKYYHLKYIQYFLCYQKRFQQILHSAKEH